jgi:2-phosphosulfolactate phosphatase
LTEQRPLQIVRTSLLTGAGRAEGVAVVIDVLRAFTSAAMMAYLGAEEIVLLAEPEAVLRLKQEQGYLAVGEVGGRRPAGFDLGNSPAQILAAGPELFSGRRVAQRTTAGTSGAVAAARRADRVILGSYVTAAAIARYIRRLSPQPRVVTLVAMGDDGLVATPEDEACADYIEGLLTCRPYDHLQTLRRVVDHECVQQFLRREQAHFPPEDPVYALQRDLFDFVLVATLECGRLTARRVDVPQQGAR